MPPQLSILPDPVIREIVDAVGKTIRVRLVTSPISVINPMSRQGKPIRLELKPYPYPNGHLQRAMVQRAKQLVRERDPHLKPPMTVVLGVTKSYTKDTFYMAIAEEE